MLKNFVFVNIYVYYWFKSLMRMVYLLVGINICWLEFEIFLKFLLCGWSKVFLSEVFGSLKWKILDELWVFFVFECELGIVF